MLSDRFFLGGLFLVVFVGDHIQLLGAPGYALVIVIFVVAGFSELFTKDKISVIGLTIWGLIYVFLSYNRIFPTAWTSHFDRGAVLQQASYLAGLLPIIAASQRFWRRAFRSVKRSSTAYAVVLVAFFLGCILDLFLLEGGFLLRVRSTLKNDTALMLFVVQHARHCPQQRNSAFATTWIYFLRRHHTRLHTDTRSVRLRLGN